MERRFTVWRRWSRCAALLLGASPSYAKCDPTAEPDKSDIATARAAVAANCDCAGATNHGQYVKCAGVQAASHPHQQELQGPGEEVRGEVDVRQARLRHLLQAEREGQGDVRDQARRVQVQGAEGRRGVRGHARELLRRVRRDEQPALLAEWGLPRRSSAFELKPIHGRGSGLPLPQQSFRCDPRIADAPSLLVLAAGPALPGLPRRGRCRHGGQRRHRARVGPEPVTFGRTTPVEVEGLLGAPVTRNADGSLVYQLGTKSHHGSPSPSASATASSPASAATAPERGAAPWHDTCHLPRPQEGLTHA